MQYTLASHSGGGGTRSVTERVKHIQYLFTLSPTNVGALPRGEPRLMFCNYCVCDTHYQRLPFEGELDFCEAKRLRDSGEAEYTHHYRFYPTIPHRLRRSPLSKRGLFIFLLSPYSYIKKICSLRDSSKSKIIPKRADMESCDKIRMIFSAIKSE